MAYNPLKSTKAKLKWYTLIQYQHLIVFDDTNYQQPKVHISNLGVLTIGLLHQPSQSNLTCSPWCFNHEDWRHQKYTSIFYIPLLCWGPKILSIMLNSKHSIGTNRHTRKKRNSRKVVWTFSWSFFPTKKLKILPVSMLWQYIQSL